ncbi:hypothetical protein AB0912_13555 [Streptomyces sp. NPDC007084]|uniref:hypothetical protein n=1 Tax=Streptomyces sp. NPDC007084 TaxID=3154313 RepID=UPI003455D965
MSGRLVANVARVPPGEPGERGLVGSVRRPRPHPYGPTTYDLAAYDLTASRP